MRRVIPEVGGSPSTYGDQLALLVESVSDYAIFMLDPEGNVVTWNRGARRIKGYEAAEIVGQHFSRFYTDPDRLRSHPQHELEIAAREGRYEEEGWRVRKDGSQFWANVVITALRDASGELVGFGKVTRDLTARRLNEEQLRATAAELQIANQELRQFRLLVASVEDYAIFMLDPGGHVATWNLGAEKLKGYAPEEAIGRHFSDFYTPEDRLRGTPAHALETAARDGHFELEGWRVRKDGRRFWANVTLTAIRDEHGMLLGYAKITRDLTERRRADEALEEAQRDLLRTNEELQHLAAAAAHDLAAPLHTVVGFAKLLKQRSGDALDEDSAGFVDSILDSTAQMRELVDELADYARAGQEVEPQRTLVEPAVLSAVRHLRAAAEEAGADLSIEVPEGIAVKADPLSLERTFQNLISNAIKFGDPQGPVVTVTASREDDHWRFEIADNGEGVEESQREVIFEPFRSAAGQQHAGTGLGLAICRKLVRRYRGEVGVVSDVSGGSRFWFTLPIAD